MIQVKDDEMSKTCSTHGEDECLPDFGGKARGKGTTKKTKLRGNGSSGMDWIDLAKDRKQWLNLVKTVMNLQVPSNVAKLLNNPLTGGFLRGAQLHGVNWFPYLPHIVSNDILVYCNKSLILVLH
jgi:hypothetical protein